jgi:hypothetical protein
MKNDMKTEVSAKILVTKLLPYLTWQSADVQDDFDAGEFVSAANGAIHDLGAVRADLPDELINEIALFIDVIRIENDAWSTRFLPHIEAGY